MKRKDHLHLYAGSGKDVALIEKGKIAGTATLLCIFPELRIDPNPNNLVHKKWHIDEIELIVRPLTDINDNEILDFRQLLNIPNASLDEIIKEINNTCNREVFSYAIQHGFDLFELLKCGAIDRATTYLRFIDDTQSYQRIFTKNPMLTKEDLLLNLSVKELQNKLSEALKNQMFEAAATYRDELKKRKINQ